MMSANCLRDVESGFAALQGKTVAANEGCLAARDNPYKAKWTTELWVSGVDQYHLNIGKKWTEILYVKLPTTKT